MCDAVVDVALQGRDSTCSGQEPNGCMKRYIPLKLGSDLDSLMLFLAWMVLVLRDMPTAVETGGEG